MLTFSNLSTYFIYYIWLVLNICYNAWHIVEAETRTKSKFRIEELTLWLFQFLWQSTGFRSYFLLFYKKEHIFMNKRTIENRCQKDL